MSVLFTGKYGPFEAETVWLKFDEIRNETEKAIRVLFSRKKLTWIPRSHIASLNREGLAIEVTRWLVERNGLKRYEMIPQDTH